MKDEDGSHLRGGLITDLLITDLLICGVRACSAEPGTEKYPPFCPMPTETAILSRAEEAYLSQDDLREFALAAARTEAAGYCKEPRVEEVMNFARRIGAQRLRIGKGERP